MNITYLLLGSNLGDRAKYLSEALEMLENNIGQIVSKSSLYNTEPWGVQHQEEYLNQAICITTPLSPGDLLASILNIELSLGRKRAQKWDARTIDIDILYYNSDIIELPDLTIPHPHLHLRKFALEPLSEIARYFMHPILKKNTEMMLADCSNELNVVKITNQ
jgi:2-amino-4-hydroxy-6-hydroxymethyldihydropteridine diphosphokinase